MKSATKYLCSLFILFSLLDKSLFSVTNKNESKNKKPDFNNSIANNLLEAKKYDELERLSKDTLEKDKNSLIACYYLFIVNSINEKTVDTKKYLDNFEKLFKSKATVIGTPETGMLIFLDKPETDVVSGKTVYLDNDMNAEQFNYIPIYSGLEYFIRPII